MATLPYNQAKEESAAEKKQQDEIKKYIDHAVAEMKASLRDEISRAIKEINLK